MIRPLILSSLAALVASAQEPLSLEQAIRTAWKEQRGLQAGQAMVEARRAEADAHRDLRLPTATLQAQGVRTDEPMMAFGLKLNQARIGAMDFNPASLNKPTAVTSFGASALVQQPLYAGGRLTAARRAGEFMAQAEAASQERRQQETAQAVVEAYFGAQVATQALTWVEDTRTWVKGMQDFVGARVQQGLMLESELLRLKAFQAQVEAQKADVQRQLQSARSGLGLLMGGAPVDGPLATKLGETNATPATSAGTRSDVKAAQLQAQAAGEGAKAAKGNLLPEVGLELGAGTMRHSLSQGGNWTWAGVGVKWKLFSAPDRAKASSARAQERAATSMAAFRQQQAEHEVRAAREAVTAADAKVEAARQAIAAAEEAKRLRELRHREGLAPLIDVLDAEAALQGARTLLLQSQYEQRVNRAALDLATGHPIEGVK